MTSISPAERARQCADAMWQNDAASKYLGIEVLSVGPGTASLRMLIENRHLNGHGVCHGGFIFTLADSAFAYACNSYNQVTVAQQAAISFISPVHPGDSLTATAREVNRSGRSGIYDIEVVRTDGQVVAEFRGCSRTVRGTNYDEPKDDR